MTIDEIEKQVEQMDIEDVAAYAREHGIDHDPIDQWLDDMWPDLDSELRTKVIDHMAEKEGLI